MLRREAIKRRGPTSLRYAIYTVALRATLVIVVWAMLIMYQDLFISSIVDSGNTHRLTGTSGRNQAGGTVATLLFVNVVLVALIMHWRLDPRVRWLGFVATVGSLWLGYVLADTITTLRYFGLIWSLTVALAIICCFVVAMSFEDS